MPNRELFPDGKPPDKAELIQYLVHARGLSTPEARKVADRYHPPDPEIPPGLLASAGGLGARVAGPAMTGIAGLLTMPGDQDIEWTEDKLQRWVDGQPEVGSVGAVTGRAGREASGVHGGSWVERHGGRYASDDARLAEATAVADEAVARARRTRDRFYRAGDMFFDSGPGMDPEALAQSLAVGYFTDAAGNPRLDDATGMPTEVTAQSLWAQIKGQTFDMGALAMPRAGRKPRPRAGREGADDARLARIDQIAQERRTFITPSMAMALLSSMDDDAIIKIQQQLWEAGLFGDTPPSWGVADETTRKAYMALFAEASLTPSEPIDRVLARLTDEAVTRGTAGGGDRSQSQVPAFKPEVASAESLSMMIDTMAQQLLGRFATDTEKASLVKELQSKEIETQRAQYDRDVSAATGGPAGGIDAFMTAIAGGETTAEPGGGYTTPNAAGSGAYGRYQIMPENWGPWAERAGLSRSAPRTPENQERVAKHIMSEYYARFGNWRDVAIAWFAGPGAVGDPSAERRSDGNMTVREYADNAMARMATLGGSSAGGAIGGAIESFDPQAEAQVRLKAADPAGWAGHQFANEAVEFFSLLQGVGG